MYVAAASLLPSLPPSLPHHNVHYPLSPYCRFLILALVLFSPSDPSPLPPSLPPSLPQTFNLAAGPLLGLAFQPLLALCRVDTRLATGLLIVSCLVSRRAGGREGGREERSKMQHLSNTSPSLPPSLPPSRPPPAAPHRPQVHRPLRRRRSQSRPCSFQRCGVQFSR